jgi:hypothetical protein
MKTFKTKAQMNWEVGKEQEKLFIDTLSLQVNRNEKICNYCGNKLLINVEEVKELFVQIRQNEYRRGKEDALKTELKGIENEN